MSSRTLQRNVAVRRSSSGTATEWIRLGSAGDAVQARVLRRTASGAIRSAVLVLPGEPRSAAGPAVREAAESYVCLRGQAIVDGAELTAGCWIHRPAGSRTTGIVATGPAEMLWISWAVADGAPTGERPTRTGDVALARHLDDAPWVDVDQPGVPPGVRVAPLIVDEVSGGDLCALELPPGFEGGGSNWHPVGEEIFCLRGDAAPDDTLELGPGDYLFNPPYSLHGMHEHSRGGALLLEGHDGPWAIHFTATLPGEGEPGRPSSCSSAGINPWWRGSARNWRAVAMPCGRSATGPSHRMTTGWWCSDSRPLRTRPCWTCRRSRSTPSWKSTWCGPGIRCSAR